MPPAYPAPWRVMNQRPSEPCGSVSRSATDLTLSAKETARFAAMVVLPDPPFCCATVITRPAISAPWTYAALRHNPYSEISRPESPSSPPRQGCRQRVGPEATGHWPRYVKRGTSRAGGDNLARPVMDVADT